MVLKNISVRSFGSIESFSCELEDGLNFINNRNFDELSFAIRFVLCSKAPPLPMARVRAGCEIKATVSSGGREYTLIAEPDDQMEGLKLKCYNERGEDAAKEYFYIADHPFEHDSSEIFDGKERNTALRFLRYANEDLCYSPRELASLTGGYSDTGAFRAYLRSFIKNFEPEIIREGKHYEISIKNDGEYVAHCKNDFGRPALLSASEQMLFKFLCFLKTAEFWRGFEELRNLNGVKKPLIIGNFLERIDESINVSDIIERTARLGRQVILFKDK